jgi:hypothetical protein
MSVWKIRKRHHWSGNHAPYENCLHDVETDDPLNIWHLVARMLADVQDGEVFEVTIRPTGAVDTDGRWELTEPHTYSWVRRAPLAEAVDESPRFVSTEGDVNGLDQ